MKVVRSVSNLIAPSSCVSYTTPSADRNTGIANSDMHFYVTAEYTNSGTLAWASQCLRDSAISLRPTMGRINYNIYNFPNSTNILLSKYT